MDTLNNKPNFISAYKPPSRYVKLYNIALFLLSINSVVKLKAMSPAAGLTIATIVNSILLVTIIVLIVRYLRNNSKRSQGKKM